MRPRALVRAFNLLLSFDSNKKDNEIEQEVLDLIKRINLILAKQLPGPIPQIEIEQTEKKLKIGIKPYNKKDLDDSLED